MWTQVLWQTTSFYSVSMLLIQISAEMHHTFFYIMLKTSSPCNAIFNGTKSKQLLSCCTELSPPPPTLFFISRNERLLAWKQHFISGIHPAVWPLPRNCEKEKDHNHPKRKSINTWENLCLCMCGTHTTSFAFQTWMLDHTLPTSHKHAPISFSSTHTNTSSLCLCFSSSGSFVLVYYASVQVSRSKGLLQEQLEIKSSAEWACCPLIYTKLVQHRSKWSLG